MEIKIFVFVNFNTQSLDHRLMTAGGGQLSYGTLKARTWHS